MKFWLFGEQKEDEWQFLLVPRQDEAYRKERDVKTVIKSFQILKFHSRSEKTDVTSQLFQSLVV